MQCSKSHNVVEGSSPFCDECGTPLMSTTTTASPNDLATQTENIPVLGKEQKLNLKALRHPTENLFLALIVAYNCMVFAILFQVIRWSFGAEGFLIIGGISLFIYLMNKLSFALFYWYLHGNSIKVSVAQYPEVYRAVKAACGYIDLKRVPTVYVMHGQGMLELFLAKRFSRKGILVFTSELIDTLLDSGDSRELMMIIGRQLGHIKLGHFRFWLFKDVIGAFTFFIYAAWRRRCHYTADRVGFLVAGSLEASRRALITLTVGKKLAMATRIEALQEQEEDLHGSFFAWLSQVSQPYPFILRRIVELESFRDRVVERPYNPAAGAEVGALPAEVNRFHIINVTGQAIFGERGTIMLSQPTR
jgi:Zn-dependent protease with chaperone function